MQSQNTYALRKREKKKVFRRPMLNLSEGNLNPTAEICNKGAHFASYSGKFTKIMGRELLQNILYSLD